VRGKIWQRGIAYATSYERIVEGALGRIGACGGLCGSVVNTTGSEVETLAMLGNAHNDQRTFLSQTCSIWGKSTMTAVAGVAVGAMIREYLE